MYKNASFLMPYAYGRMNKTQKKISHKNTFVQKKKKNKGKEKKKYNSVDGFLKQDVGLV